MIGFRLPFYRSRSKARAPEAIFAGIGMTKGSAPHCKPAEHARRMMREWALSWDKRHLARRHD